MILSETRKYEVGLVMANQFADQLDAKILSSVIGNVSTFLLFQLDQRDARHFIGGIKRSLSAPEIAHALMYDNPKDLNLNELTREKVSFGPDELTNLATGYALYKAADGDANITHVFPNEGNLYGLGEQIRENTLAQYGMNRTDLSPSCDSRQVPHTEGDDKPEPEYGAPVPTD